MRFSFEPTRCAGMKSSNLFSAFLLLGLQRERFGRGADVLGGYNTAANRNGGMTLTNGREMKVLSLSLYRLISTSDA